MNSQFIKIVIKMTKIFFVFLLIFSIGLIGNKLQMEKNTIQTTSQKLSNKKIGWGLKRNDNHEQPDLGESNIQLLKNNNGIAIGNKDKKLIYLTFDQGYEAGYTSQILEALKETDVKATFFITAHYLNTEPDLVKRMIEDGHIVGNHTVNHKSMPDITEKDIEKELMDLHIAINDKYGYEMKYMRPPKGEYSERTLSITNSLGYQTVMWSFAYEDWDENKQPEENEAKKKILDNIHNGEIMLLHATSKTNAYILKDIIKEIKAQGFTFKSLDEFER